MNKSHIKTYLIECQETKFIKIGKSENPKERIVSLQCGSTTKLRLVHIIDADIERLLHKAFIDKNFRGEWFCVSAEEILAHVNLIDLSDYQISKDVIKERRAKCGDAIAKAICDIRFKETSPIDENGMSCLWISALNRFSDNGVPYYESKRFLNENILKEYNMINMIVFGAPEESLRLVLRINDYDDLGPSLPKKHFEAMRDLQRANTVYIEDGLDFQERKKKLTDLFNRKHKQKLIDEIHLLEA